jgi:hypothetical protein
MTLSASTANVNAPRSLVSGICSRETSVAIALLRVIATPRHEC